MFEVFMGVTMVMVMVGRVVHSNPLLTLEKSGVDAIVSRLH